MIYIILCGQQRQEECLEFIRMCTAVALLALLFLKTAEELQGQAQKNYAHVRVSDCRSPRAYLIKCSIDINGAATWHSFFRAPLKRTSSETDAVGDSEQCDET